MTANKTPKSKSWKAVQDGLAKEAGLAITLVGSEGLSSLSDSNNNSICEVLISSKDFESECQRFCGSAFRKTIDAKKALKYKCHAGLECVAVPIETDNKRELVAITGRVFTKASDYKNATEKAVSGEWKQFPPTKFFENILLTSSTENIKKLGERISRLRDEERLSLQYLDSVSDLEKNLSGQAVADVESPQEERVDVAPQLEAAKTEKKELPESQPEKEPWQKRNEDAIELAAWRSFFNLLHDLEYKDACLSLLTFVKERYEISSLAWLENVEDQLEKVLSIGGLEGQNIRISVATTGKRLLGVFRKQSSIELQERNGKSDAEKNQSIRLFPVVLREEIRSALVVGEPSTGKIRRHISRFCQFAASELEILRLRRELSKQLWLDNALARFNASLEMVDTNDFWYSALETSAELLRAERGSLLVYDEKSEKLIVKAAIGEKSDLIENAEIEIGARIAKNVWKNGKSLVVADANKIGLPPPPPDWNYSTGSFISYPISIGDRRVGVINLTDKIDGRVFDKSDLKLLKSIAPQLAVAIDRASLKSKAGEFELLSVTDPLTGLLNRRYLEERLTEEIKRSDRHGYPMSFLMIDVDEFKSYNDSFTHPEGDKALQLVAQCLKESLRDADVAARYGGEEFSILLPQTHLEEARTISERLREKIATAEFPNRQVTVSIGITGASSSRNTAEEIISAADKALFEAKRRGRNNVQTYEYVRKDLKIES